jgi:hypothetical protein
MSPGAHALFVFVNQDYKNTIGRHVMVGWYYVRISIAR